MQLPTDTTYTYKLYKLSKPGWVRHYDCEEDLANDLFEYICGSCIEEFGSSLYDMLASPCGCEFLMEDDLEQKPTEFEELERDFEKELV